MVVESHMTAGSCGTQWWRLHACPAVEHPCGALYQHVVTGGGTVGVVSLGAPSSRGQALEDVPVVAATAHIIPTTLSFLKGASA